jgi:hypothetical protein
MIASLRPGTSRSRSVNHLTATFGDVSCVPRDKREYSARAVVKLNKRRKVYCRKQRTFVKVIGLLVATEPRDAIPHHAGNPMLSVATPVVSTLRQRLECSVDEVRDCVWHDAGNPTTSVGTPTRGSAWSEGGPQDAIRYDAAQQTRVSSNAHTRFRISGTPWKIDVECLDGCPNKYVELKVGKRA